MRHRNLVTRSVDRERTQLYDPMRQDTAVRMNELHPTISSIVGRNWPDVQICGRLSPGLGNANRRAVAATRQTSRGWRLFTFSKTG